MSGDHEDCMHVDLWGFFSCRILFTKELGAQLRNVVSIGWTDYSDGSGSAIHTNLGCSHCPWSKTHDKPIHANCVISAMAACANN